MPESLFFFLFFYMIYNPIWPDVRSPIATRSVPTILNIVIGKFSYVNSKYGVVTEVSLTNEHEFFLRKIVKHNKPIQF